VLGLILIGAAPASAQLGTAVTSDLIAELEAGSENTSVMQELGRRSADPTASAALEKAFKSAQDRDRKKQIAFAVSLGKRLAPWIYREVESFAAEAIGSGSPPMLRFDSAGQPIRGEVTTEYSEWCRLQGLTESDCVGRHMQRYLRDIIFLGTLRDPRSIPLLRKGLETTDPLLIFTCISVLGSMPDVTVVDDVVRISKDARLQASTRELVRNILRTIDVEGASTRLRFLLDNDAYNQYLQERAEFVSQRALRKAK